MPRSAREIASKRGHGNTSSKREISRKKYLAILLVCGKSSTVEVKIGVMSEHSCFVEPLKWIF